MENEALTKEVIARKFAIGQMLDIEIQDVTRTRFQAPLVGMKEGRYIVTDLPSLTRHGNLRDQLLDDQAVIVRTLCEKTTGECLGFRSYVFAKVKQPDQLLFLTFPPTAQIVELREEKRMLVTQKAQLVSEHGERAIFGMITDLSGGGCRFEYEASGELPPKKEDSVEICFEHPETGKDVKWRSRICSVRNYQNLVSIGMAFVKQSRASKSIPDPAAAI